MILKKVVAASFVVENVACLPFGAWQEVCSRFLKTFLLLNTDEDALISEAKQYTYQNVWKQMHVSVVWGDQCSLPLYKLQMSLPY